MIYDYISYTRRLNRIELLIYGYGYLDLYYLFSNDSTIKSINLSLDFYLLLSFFITLNDYYIIHYYQNYGFLKTLLHVYSSTLILLKYMIYDGNCIWNDQELSIVIYSNITTMLLMYVIILYLAKGGVRSWDYNKSYNNG